MYKGISVGENPARSDCPGKVNFVLGQVKSKSQWHIALGK